MENGICVYVPLLSRVVPQSKLVSLTIPGASEWHVVLATAPHAIVGRVSESTLQTLSTMITSSYLLKADLESNETLVFKDELEANHLRKKTRIAGSNTMKVLWDREEQLV